MFLGTKIITSLFFQPFLCDFYKFFQKEVYEDNNNTECQAIHPKTESPRNQSEPIQSDDFRGIILSDKMYLNLFTHPITVP